MCENREHSVGIDHAWAFNSLVLHGPQVQSIAIF